MPGAARGRRVRERLAPALALVAVTLAAVPLAACSTTVPGSAVRAAPGPDDDSLSPVDVDAVLLEQTQMRAITGAGDDLTVIPTMDGKVPVDIDVFADPAPPPCRWFFAETQTFGPDIEEFHKTTYQHPPGGGLISQGAAGYRDTATAQRAFEALAASVTECESTPSGAALYVGDLVSDAESLRLRAGDCGRDYLVKSVVLLEVTFCRFPPSVPDIVMANLAAQLPGP